MAFLAWGTTTVLAARQARELEGVEVRSLTARMKTVCVGRFLIDMPAEAQVELVGPRIDGFRILAFTETEDEFRSRLADREAQIKAIPDRFGGDRNLKSAKDFETKHVAGKVFVHGRIVTEGTQANGLELETYRYEGVAVEALLHGKGVSIDLVADNYDPDRIGNISRLAAQLLPNPENALTTIPGFCINYAYVMDPLAAAQREEIIMRARLPSHPDVKLMFISAAGTKPEKQGLLERSAPSSWLSKFDRRIVRLRGAKRAIDGMSGEELVERFVENNHIVVYSHWWEVNGTEDNLFAPHLSLTMDTGKGENGPVPSSLSEAAAIGLWDSILSSLRLRPTKPDKEAAERRTH